MRRSYFKKGDWNAICDGCGFEYKASELRKTWDGRRVCKKDWESQHPSEFARAVAEDTSVPWTRQEVLPADQQANTSGIVIPATILDPSFLITDGTDVWIIIDPDTGVETTGIGDNWTVSNGVATHTTPDATNWNSGPYQDEGMDIGVYQAAVITDGTEYEITQSFAYIAGETYTVHLYLSNVTAGTITPKLGGTTAVTGTARSANGIYEEDLVANSSSNEFTLIASEDFVGSIKYVNVVKKVVSNL